MSKFNALYNKIVLEQAVEPPSHREGLKPHIAMMGGIVKKQDVSKQPEVINSIMQGITNPNADTRNLSQYGVELPDLTKKISSYIQVQPKEHQADIIERVRQGITHPESNK
jgi:hypothetical protein